MGARSRGLLLFTTEELWKTFSKFSMSSSPLLLLSRPLKSGCSLRLSTNALPQHHTPIPGAFLSRAALLLSLPWLPTSLQRKTKPSPGSYAAWPLPVSPPSAHSGSPCTFRSSHIGVVIHSHLRYFLLPWDSVRAVPSSWNVLFSPNKWWLIILFSTYGSLSLGSLSW